MAMQRLIDFLDDHHIKYSSIHHTTAYTAQQTAQSAHLPGKMLAKTVIVKLDGELAMVVLPAYHQLDLEALKESTGANQVDIAREFEFTERFPDCEVGAMPPFGNLYDMKVYMDPDLKKDKEIAFNAGTHTELIQMSYKDFESLVKPKLLKGWH